ncbi:hypothetical protein NDU88_000395 [Pleurodeles waltl]|uniref:Uncharacterized protein n=1 Tax=Pleurodeles waltl TaxID=8319 RepID=A0AAV7WFE1_PLEWA|nr:hypothetical protein NDU88_000395 [Pleurodeles waltl]
MLRLEKTVGANQNLFESIVFIVVDGAAIDREVVGVVVNGVINGINGDSLHFSVVFAFFAEVDGPDDEKRNCFVDGSNLDVFVDAFFTWGVDDDISGVTADWTQVLMS